MATKKQIAEQVLKIVNGGRHSDDAKITLQEVGVLMEHERDALVRKTILENTTLGEHEIPSEFLSLHILPLKNDTSGVYGALGRAYVELPQMPVNLPNDASIYRVCQIDNTHRVEAGTIDNRDEWKFSFSGNIEKHADMAPARAQIRFGLLNREYENLGSKFELILNYGPTTTTLKEYKFTFNYIDGDVSASDIKPDRLTMSLHRDPDFMNFLVSNSLILTHSIVGSSGVESIWAWNFESNNKDFSLGATDSGTMSLKSVLTKDKVVDYSDTNNPNAIGGWVEGNTDIYPWVGFNLQISYPNNKRIYDLEPDLLGIKAKNSCTLNTSVSISMDEMQSENYSDDDAQGVTGVTSTNLAKIWMNKYAEPLQRYGIHATMGGATIYLKEAFAHGGITSVEGSSNVTTITVSSNVVAYDWTEMAKYKELSCYSRMANPGIYSNMYDSAISLSGRKYWYRQLNGLQNQDTKGMGFDDGGDSTNRIYFYGENPYYDTNNDGVNSKNAFSRMSVWMVSKSRSIKFDEQFPIPSDATVEMIKSLVATFSAMRAAKEDLTNDNIDIT